MSADEIRYETVSAVGTFGPCDQCGVSLSTDVSPRFMADWQPVTFVVAHLPGGRARRYYCPPCASAVAAGAPLRPANAR